MDPFLRNRPQVSDSGIGLLLVVAESLNAWINVTWSCSSCIRMTFSQGLLSGPTMGFLFSWRHKWYRSVQHYTGVSLGEFVKCRLCEALMAGCISLQDQYHVTYIIGPLFHLCLVFSLLISTSGYICGFIDAHWTHPNVNNKTLMQFPKEVQVTFYPPNNKKERNKCIA